MGLVSTLLPIQAHLWGIVLVPFYEMFVKSILNDYLLSSYARTGAAWNKSKFENSSSLVDSLFLVLYPKLAYMLIISSPFLCSIQLGVHGYC